MKFDPSAWSLSRPRLGDLNTCLISPTTAAPKALVVLCHGFGAPGTDLVPIFDELRHLLPDNSEPFAFLCPQGPVDLGDDSMGDGRAWWPLNMALLMQLAATNSFDELRDAIPPEIDDARTSLCNCVRATCELLQQESQIISPLPIILGGFSQGCMLATDTLFRGDLSNVAGLFAFSGALICESAWLATKNHVHGLPYVQCHGRFDPVLPFSTGKNLNSLFQRLNMAGGLLEFDGPHTIPSEGIVQAAKLLHTITTTGSKA